MTALDLLTALDARPVRPSAAAARAGSPGATAFAEAVRDAVRETAAPGPGATDDPGSAAETTTEAEPAAAVPVEGAATVSPVLPAPPTPAGAGAPLVTTLSAESDAPPATTETPMAVSPPRLPSAAGQDALLVPGEGTAGAAATPASGETVGTPSSASPSDARDAVAVPLLPTSVPPSAPSPDPATVRPGLRPPTPGRETGEVAPPGTAVGNGTATGTDLSLPRVSAAAPARTSTVPSTSAAEATTADDAVPVPAAPSIPASVAPPAAAPPSVDPVAAGSAAAPSPVVATALAPAAPPSAVAAPARPALLPQVAAPVVSLAQAPDGDHRITLTVSPENLGPVTVRALIAGSTIRIELHAPGELGRDALRAILGDLRRDLAIAAPQATLSLTTSDGSPSSPQHGGTGGQTGNGGADAQRHQATARASAVPPTPAEVPPPPPPAPPVAPLGGIDVYA
ncbi:hypothetical protein OYT00_09905 [Microbacterium paraoxydans]|uniref:flagellar hook-length control protein FliK n=1 Tax=Microbacterium TaxID=33882 RepID=UPI0016573506|nr:MULTISPECIES: flagellar hook-length control protein FliK [Microbacterium]MCZ0710315.1 hypothetical protein [Microbacterium paraoxydans]CAD5138309.1 Flg_hook domain-containing protein [Microbacterium sp. Nx66]